MEENRHPRDRATGRYQHQWGVIGETGHDYAPDQGEVAECQLCGVVEEYGRKGGTRRFRNRAAAVRAGLKLLESY